MDEAPRGGAGFESIGIVDAVRPLGQQLLESARLAPDNEALVFPDARFTYAEIAARAWGTARSLAALGVRPGDHVGILMTNHPDLVTSYYGILLLGAVAVPINARYRRQELAFLLADCGLTALLTHDSAAARVDFAALLDEALPGLSASADPHRLELEDFPALRFVAMMGGSTPPGMIGRAEFAAAAGAADLATVRNWAAGVKVRDLAIILYTSGTTARPRGAMITHEAFSRVWLDTGKAFGTTASDRHWTALPLFHVTALGCMTWVHCYRATFLSDYLVVPERALETLERERVTEFYPAYPAVMEGITGHPRFASTDLGALRVFLNVAPPEQLAKFQERLPHAVQMTTYGCTEGGPVTLTRLDDSLDTRLNTCGRPQRGYEVEIRDEAGAPLGPGERGEIHFRGPNVFSGYYRDPEKTAATLLEGGWVKPGDLGVLDEEGRLLFLGRSKETLKVGGENVAPQEIEERLLSHPAVKLAQVVGVPDPRLDEVAAAFVEPVEGAGVTEAELIEHCRGHLASFKVPRTIRIIDGEEWPMSATKIQRSRLRERLLDEFASEASVRPTAR